jgi:signal transduction histidine kinase
MLAGAKGPATGVLGATARRTRDLFAPDRLLRSAGVRFGLIYAALFALSALGLAAFVWWSTAGLLQRQTDAAINADSQGLVERYADGPAALQDVIRDRLDSNIDDDAIYLLTGPDFRKVAGNLEGWPRGLTLDVEWFDLQVERAGIRGMARVRHLDLVGGFHLLVGRDVEVRSQLRDMLADALLWAGGIALVMGTGGALAVRSLFRVTLKDVSETAAAISAGDLTRRVRVAGHGDEFDALAETINDMLDRIVLLMDGVRQVSNAIAHDLRTPITRARARLEDAAAHATTAADLHAAVERATDDLDGIVAVFQALLRIAEIEAGARRSAFAPVDLAPLLLDLADLYSAAAEEQGVTIEPRIAPALPVLGDREMMQQAVVNLLDNALKFSPPGGVVRVVGMLGPGIVRIEISDQGPGMPEADRARAAERFFRGESARSTPGSGLGLSLVQAVATLHGGMLTLADAGGPEGQRGLAAVLTVPVRGGPAVALQGAHAQIAGSDAAAPHGPPEFGG